MHVHVCRPGAKPLCHMRHRDKCAIQRYAGAAAKVRLRSILLQLDCRIGKVGTKGMHAGDVSYGFQKLAICSNSPTMLPYVATLCKYRRPNTNVSDL
jgi:hypothetical protein